jgi:hypothetical protein
MDRVHKPIATQCYTPSSKPFRIYLRFSRHKRSVYITILLKIRPFLLSFWNDTLRRLVFRYRRFGTTSVPSLRVKQSNSFFFDSFISQMGMKCPETSITNYQLTSHKNPVERRPQLQMPEISQNTVLNVFFLTNVRIFLYVHARIMQIRA